MLHVVTCTYVQWKCWHCWKIPNRCCANFASVPVWNIVLCHTKKVDLPIHKYGNLNMGFYCWDYNNILRCLLFYHWRVKRPISYYNRIWFEGLENTISCCTRTFHDFSVRNYIIDIVYTGFGLPVFFNQMYLLELFYLLWLSLYSRNDRQNIIIITITACKNIVTVANIRFSRELKRHVPAPQAHNSVRFILRRFIWH